MTDQEVLFKLIEVPTQEQANKFLENIDVDDVDKALGKSLIYVNQKIGLLQNAIVDLEQNKKDSKDDQKLIQFFVEEQVILEQKLDEKRLLKNLIKNRYELLKNKITIDEYQIKRDQSLRGIIFSRAKLYRNKEWFKYWCAFKQMTIDSEWFNQFDINLYENNKDIKRVQKTYKFEESKEICDIIKGKVAKNLEILPDSNSIREILSLKLIIPDYIANKISMSYLRDNAKNLESKTR